MASRLFALDGAEVAEVDEEPGGGRTVRARRMWPMVAVGSGWCGEAAVGVPGCLLPPQDIHRVAAGRPATVPGDRAAA